MLSWHMFPTWLFKDKMGLFIIKYHFWHSLFSNVFISAICFPQKTLLYKINCCIWIRSNIWKTKLCHNETMLLWLFLKPRSIIHIVVKMFSATRGLSQSILSGWSAAVSVFGSFRGAVVAMEISSSEICTSILPISNYSFQLLNDTHLCKPFFLSTKRTNFPSILFNSEPLSRKLKLELLSLKAISCFSSSRTPKWPLCKCFNRCDVDWSNKCTSFLFMVITHTVWHEWV